MPVLVAGHHHVPARVFEFGGPVGVSASIWVKVNAEMAAMLERNGSTRAPAGMISSVETSSPTLRATVASSRSGSGSKSGSEAMFGPFTSRSPWAYPAGRGGTSMDVFTCERAGSVPAA